jgi:Bacterial Ig-like domain
MLANRKNLIFGTIFLLACSGGVKVTQGNDGSASLYKPNELTSASAEISASSGGYINVGKAQLVIPAQALDSDTTITAEVADIALPSGGAKAMGKGIRLKPEGLQFLKPAELMLCYTPAEAANLNAQGAQIYYHTDDNQYVAIAGSVDLNTNCVKSHIEHFSSYVAAASLQLPGNPAPVIGGANFLPTTPLAGIPLRVRTSITDFNGPAAPAGPTPGVVVTAFFYYRHLGDATYTKVALQPDTTDDAVTNRYYFQIPANEVTTTNIEYYFEATDNLGKMARLPAGANSFSTRSVPSAATALRFNPGTTLQISAGFSRALTLQATDNGTTWQNISTDNFALTNSSLGSVVRSGPSTVRFNAVGAGSGQITSALGSLTTSTNINVVPGLLTHIEITDTNQVALTGTLQLPVSQVYDFDVVGYDSYGNVAQIYPVFTTTGGIGSVNVDPLGAHFTPAATVATGSIIADLAGLTDTLNISLYAPPQVTATAPFDNTTGIALNASVGVSFSHVMDTSTLTTTTTAACVGSLQVSSDNFVTCLPMTSATPAFHASNTLAVIQPAANLLGSTTYKIRVTTAARDTGGYPIAQVYTTPTGFTTVTAPTSALPGDALWARTPLVAADSSSFKAIAVDGTGAVYAIGTIRDGVYTFGSGVSVTAAPLITQFTSTPVIVKYDSFGTALWARTPIPSAQGVNFNSITTDSNNNIYLVADQYGSGTKDYGSGVTVTTSGLTFHAVIIKYDSFGNALWGRAVVPATTDPSFWVASVYSGVHVDANGNIYAVGNVYGPGDADLGSGVSVPRPSPLSMGLGMPRVLIAKYDNAGNTLWGRGLADNPTGMSFFYKVTTDAGGGVYAAGRQDGNGSFLFGSGVSIAGPSSGSNGILIKYDGTGNTLWGKTLISAPGDTSFIDIKADVAGNIFIAGVQFGSGSYNYGNGVMATGSYASGVNSLLLKYDSNGNAIWARSTTAGTDMSLFNRLILDGGTNIYVAGVQYGGGAFSYGNAIAVSAPNLGGPNPILLKFNDLGILQTAKTLVAAADSSGFGDVAVSGSGVFVGGYQAGAGIFEFGNSIFTSGPFAGNWNSLIVKYQK